MNKLILLLLLFINYSTFAQCNYYYLQNNKTVTIGMFDRKGNPDGKYVYKVSGVAKNSSGSSATVQSEVFDRKGKSMGGGSGAMMCKNGVLMIDMKMLLNPQQMEQFKNAKVEGKSSYMEYPTSLTVGQNLPDGKFNMDMVLDGGIAANISMEVTNRKVEAKEKTTTPAGSWDAYKITYDAKTVITMGVSIPIKIQQTEWFVPDFGMIKSSSKWGTQELQSIQ